MVYKKEMGSVLSGLKNVTENKFENAASPPFAIFYNKLSTSSAFLDASNDLYVSYARESHGCGRR